MNKFCIELPETKQETIDFFVKSCVGDSDMNIWLARAKKENILNKLTMLHTVIYDYDKQFQFPKPSEFPEISSAVEQQVLDLILSFEENR